MQSPLPDDVLSRSLSQSFAGTVALLDVADASCLLDPSVYDDAILFAAGQAQDALDRLVRYDTVTGEAEGVLVPMRFDTLRNPVEDDARIVYVDAKRGGGGAIRAFDKATGETSLICEVETDIPVLCYATPYLVWRERTADGTVKVFACHLGTGDTVTLSVPETEDIACSSPALSNGAAVYAVQDPADSRHGVVRTVHLIDGLVDDFAPGTYVHNPKRMDSVLAWTSGNHGADNDLYCSQNGGVPTRIAKGVVDFGLTERCAAYGLNGTVYTYEYETEETIAISAGGNAQFAAAGGRVIVWRDMTNPDSPVWKYMRMD